MKKTFFISLLVNLISLSAFSQIVAPVHWSFTSNNLGNNEYELVFTANIDKPWHLYSQKIDEQPPATLFTFTENTNFELIGIVEETESVEVYDPNFEMMIRYFSEKAVFKQKVKIAENSLTTIQGVIEFMCCDDTRCLPPTEIDFSFKDLGNGQTNNQETQISKLEETQNSIGDSESTSKTLWVFFFIALMSGFVGVLTPCVYPMIPLTVSFFMNNSKNKTQAKTNALVFGLSIIIIYTFIGVLVSVLFGADSIKSVSSHWITNTIFFLLFAVFSASFFGLFEFVLPTKLTNKSDQKADKGGFIGAFFMALTLVLVSFSCTAPFVGGILVEASTGSIIMPAVGMFGFSLAFALPFTLLAFFLLLWENFRNLEAG